MGFWTWVLGTAGESPNANPSSSVGPPGYHPGNPHGAVLSPATDGVAVRALPGLSPSPWSGWPAEWSTAFDMYGMQLGALVDTAWDAIDLNARVLSSMPAYHVLNSAAIAPVSWMTMPAEGLYTSWAEFVKRLFWDFYVGEAFVLSLARNSQGYPAAMTVVPPWCVTYTGGEYQIVGYPDFAPEDLLHIRYSHRVGQPAFEGWWRGVGPLEVSGARVTAARLLQRYQADYLQSGGIPRYSLETDRPMTQQQVDMLMTEWQGSRWGLGPTDPAVLTGGTKMNSIAQPSPRDVMLLEIEQFNEARISIKLGVPPFLLGLPSGGDPMTYSNVTALFDYHYRAGLRPSMNAVMTALSNWALPRGHSIELNGDDYTRPPLLERAQAYQIFVQIGALTGQEVRAMERFGPDDDADDAGADTTAATVLTGGDQ